MAQAHLSVQQISTLFCLRSLTARAFRCPEQRAVYFHCDRRNTRPKIPETGIFPTFCSRKVIAMTCEKEIAKVDDLLARLSAAQQDGQNELPDQRALAQNLGMRLVRAGQELQRSRPAPSSAPSPPPASPCDALRALVDSLLEQYSEAQLACHEGNQRQCGHATILLRQLANAQSKLQDCLHTKFFSNLAIVAIERTQAIQFLLVNGQGSGAAPDNSVPLFASKPMALRVYVNQTAMPGLPVPAYITGTVTVTTVAGSTDVAAFVPIPARPASSINRGNVNHTLNFLIPGGLCVKGAVDFKVDVFDPSHPGDPAYASLPVTFTAHFDLVPGLDVHGVLINYTGPGVGPNDPPLNLPAPTPQQLIDTLSYISRVYPISVITIGGTEVAKFSGNLANQQGAGCGLGWTQLLTMLGNMKAASGRKSVYIGLLPLGTPHGSYIGCGVGGVNSCAAAFENDGTTLAQEVGHAFARAHAPCGNPGSPDPNYPVYGSYRSGSIGEFGFDTLKNEVFDPATCADFMSYCSPTWVSPYTYAALRNALGPAFPSPQSPQAPERRDVEEEYLYLNFRFHEVGRVVMLPSFHLKSVAPANCAGRSASVSCDLLGAADEILYSHRCHLTDPHLCPDAPELLFREAIPWYSETHAIAFRRGTEVCYRYELEASPAEVAIDVPEGLREKSGMMRLHWKPGKNAKVDKGQAGRKVTYLLRYSRDGGATWQALAADLTEPQAEISLDMLPGGQDCRFQVVASSGIRTTVSESDRFAIAVKPAQVYIFEPADGAVFLEGESIVFRGSAFSPNHGIAQFEDLLWSSRLNGQIAVGYECAVSMLGLGQHQITLSVPDGLGGEATAAVRIEVRSNS
jgi:hypothetical protein